MLKKSLFSLSSSKKSSAISSKKKNNISKKYNIGVRIKNLLNASKFYKRPVDTGKIISVKDGVAKASGL
jgi:hypothetical protein